MAILPLLQQLWQLQLNVLHFGSLFILLVVFFSFLFILKLPRGVQVKLPPSPPKLPIIANLHQLGTLPHRSLRALSQKYGPIMLLHLGYAPTLVVSSADIAKEIMKTHDAIFSNRLQTKAAHTFFYRCTDLGFAPHGDYWRQVRKICVTELFSLKMVQSFEFVREEVVEESIEMIRHSCIAGASVNLTQVLVNISNNVISKIVIGQKCEGVGENSFGEISKRFIALFVAFSFEDFFPSLGWMDTLSGLNASLKKTCGDLHGFIDQVVDDHKNSKNTDNPSYKKDFTDILLGFQKDGMLSEDNIKAILLDMFLAGTDSTSATMEWAMAELVKNPVMMKKAQEEVRRLVGQKSKVEEDDINQMNYLKCIQKETLRLYPPGPFLLPRESAATVTQLEGFDIPPKTRIFINAWAIQRDPLLWDRPEEFLPERFLDNPVDFKGQDFHFIPFGAGRRGCAGMAFATVEAEYVLANLLYWFDWKLPGGETEKNMDMSDLYGVVVRKKTPLQLVPMMHSF